MPVDTKDWQIPTEQGYRFQIPYIRTVHFKNNTALCAIDVIAHDKEANSDHGSGDNGRLQDGDDRSYDLFTDFGLKEGTQIQFGADIVDGAKGHRDNNNVFIASANPWKDGLQYHANVTVGGAVLTPSISTENPQVNNH